jgi:putative tricarboxylic transport membrane protein
MMMKRLDSEVIGGLFWAVVGVFFAYGAVRLKLGTLRNPGPGFIPLGMALLLIFLSLFTLTKGLIRPAGQAAAIPWKRPALVIGSIVIYGFLLSVIGFLPSTFILMVILFNLLITIKMRKWLYVILCAAATALCSWLVFSVFLRVPFP